MTTNTASTVLITRPRRVATGMLAAAAIVGFGVTASASAATAPATVHPIGVTAGIETHAGEGTNGFATIETWMDWQSGSVVLAGTRDGKGDTAVDDRLTVTAIHADGTKATAFDVDYSQGCTTDGPAPFHPFDISRALKPGRNLLVFRFADQCGYLVSSSPLWLVPNAVVTSGTEPPPRHAETATPDFSIAGGEGPETGLNLGPTYQETAFGTGYTSGPFRLAANEAGTGATTIHGVLKIVVHHNDGTQSTASYGQTASCTAGQTIPVADVSRLFKPGFNQVVAYLNQACGAPISNSAMWLAR